MLTYGTPELFFLNTLLNILQISEYSAHYNTYNIWNKYKYETHTILDMLNNISYESLQYKSGTRSDNNIHGDTQKGFTSNGALGYIRRMHIHIVPHHAVLSLLWHSETYYE